MHVARGWAKRSSERYYMKRITLADIQNTQNPQTAGDAKTDRGIFLAPDLAVEIRDPSGNVVAEGTMESRAFTPKLAKDASEGDKPTGGIGWYCNLQPKDGAKFAGLKLSGGFRLSVHGLKIAEGEVVDLMTSTDDGDDS